MSAARELTWGRCDCCGGSLPLIDGDNDCDAPSHTGGECPGYVSPEGNCGCYDDAELAEWVEGLEVAS